MARREASTRTRRPRRGDVPQRASATSTSAPRLRAGLPESYFGTLVGIHHESKSRGQACEDVEFSALHERHAQTFASWRLRTLSLGVDHLWPLPPPAPLALAPPPAPEPVVAEPVVAEPVPAEPTSPSRFPAEPVPAEPVPAEPEVIVIAEPAERPLRYRVADRLNVVIPVPVRRLAKRSMIAGWRPMRGGPSRPHRTPRRAASRGPISSSATGSGRDTAGIPEPRARRARAAGSRRSVPPASVRREPMSPDEVR